MSNNISIFNVGNTNYKKGNYPLFLGEGLALLDTINKPHPKLFALYEQQMAFGWKWNEVNLSQDRMDMTKAPKEVVDLMVDTLLYQWHIDSVAANGIIQLFSPFISSSVLASLFTEITRMEVIHAHSYSHIIQQTMQDPHKALEKAMTLQSSLDRGEGIVSWFDKLAAMGAKLRLGMVKKDDGEVVDTVIMAMVNLYILEQLSFISSFAVTFAISELRYFQGIGRLVGLICRDEWHVHAAADKLIVEELKEVYPKHFKRLQPQILKMISDAVTTEKTWNNYLFSNRTCVGLTETLLNEWVDYMAQYIYSTIGVDSPVEIKRNPLPYMNYYLDPNSTQIAAQESDLNSYQLDSIADDLDGDILDF